MAIAGTHTEWADRTPPLKTLYMEEHYSTPEEWDETTGIRPGSAESLLFSCRSGSRFERVVEGLIKFIRESEVSGYRIPYLVFEKITEDKLAPATVAEKLSLIRDAFGLSMSAMSDVLRSSRASVYNWYETEPSGKEVLRRIDDLYEIAQQWNDMNPYHYAPGKLMKQKLADGPSMLERLGQETLDRQTIRLGLEGLLALMRKQRERMDRAKTRSANLPQNSESHKELMERLTGSVTAGR